MDKNKNKGLTDVQEGEFILNESGTSVSIDADSDLSEEEKVPDSDEAASDNNDEEAKGK